MKIKLFAVLFLILTGCSKQSPKTSPILYYVPQNSAIIIKINDKPSFSSELENSDLLKTLSATTSYNAIQEKLKALKYIQPNGESILAFVELGKANFELLLIAENSDDLFQIAEGSNNVIENVGYEGKNFDSYSVDGANFFSTVLDDKIIVSTAQMLIENILRNEQDLTADESLNKLYQIANNQSSANIFINTNKSNSLLNHIMSDGHQIDISKFTDWISLDFNTNKDHLKLNGISMANDSIINFSNLFKNSHALTPKTPTLAPMNSDAILAFTFDNYKDFALNQKKYLDRSTVIDTTFKAVEEIGFVYLNNEKAAILHTYGSENILNYLDKLEKTSEEYQGNEIVGLSKSDFLNHYFNPLVQDFEANYYTIIENAFVFSPTPETLKTIIGNFKNVSTFEKTSVYKTAKEQLADESSMLFVSNAKGIEYFLDQYIVKDIAKNIKTKELTEYSFAAQMVADDNFHHTNILFQKIAHETTLNKTIPYFTLQLDTEIVTPPQFVKNHRTNKEEIIVQDQDNNLYLISTDGKVIWKKQLSGRIQGRVEQVDLYKNGRLQLAFTTDNQFMIVDRNGKDVPPFTFTYEGGNLNPLAVFDYDRRKDYRFLVTQGTKIFMYNSSGQIVKGFKYTKSANPILGTPKHFRVGKKDYLVMKQEGGELKILSRTGDTRVNVSNKISFSDNEILLHKNKFTVTDTKGRLFQIDENGKTNAANLNLLPDHGLDATSNTLAIMNDNVLTIRSKKVELELGVYSKPKIFYLNDKIYISVTDIQNQKIYLFDSQAEAISNFPVPGNSSIDLIDMDNDHKLELVAKDQDNSIIVYKIN
ncbi:ribonuclease HII [Arenibacter sp. ARW7G5Y1]|uniref:ribonuclease HII n=1 Tax=Arenibacter sp. ARW7G5Y1 TaxID=2135619 RepID=UPI000D771C78|nr:ribonuclease HII [Arenibacter sp. ARW7G5Y1]